MKIGPRLRTGAIAGGLLAALLVVAVVAYHGDLRREIERVSTGSQVVDTPCGPIEFAAIGTGPAVLLVHGAGGGFDQGLGIAQELAAHGFHVIAMSRFGYLRTPLPADASPAAQADAHACLLDALGIERAAIVGVSAGAPSSMQFALRHPKRTAAMVLLVPLAYAPREASAAPAGPSPAARFMIEQATKSDLLYWAALKGAPSLIVKTILGTPPEVLATASAEEQARVRKLMLHILPLSKRQPGLLNEAAIAASLPRYDLERISTPTLVVSVADDLYGTFESARYTAAHIRGARFIGYASGGHLWVGHHDEILFELLAFLGKPALPLAGLHR
jgi:pimeloyl-ACP methyl ester carboxylesterase